MLKEDNEFGKYVNKDGDFFVKELRFSYIRLIDSTTRLIVYNCFNITGVEGIIYRRKVIIKVPDSCMIVFTSDIFHAGFLSYDRKSGTYLPHLRMFAYTVGNNYVSRRDYISKISEKMRYEVNCATYREIPNENINYERYIIKYLNSKYNIDKLPMGKVLLGDFKKVGLVVLKCDYIITPRSNIENYLYHLNKSIHK